METGIPAEVLTTREVDQSEATAVMAAAERQHAAPLHYLDGSHGLATFPISSRGLQLRAQHGRLA